MSGAGEVAALLEGWANQVVARYGHPVYLVGSALEQGLAARDVDVVVILPNEEYWGRYGRDTRVQSLLGDWSEANLRWAADMGKLASYVAKHFHVNLDVKVQPAMFAMLVHAGKPRLRIDKVFDVPEVELLEVAR